jgi:hypothetical protein
MLKIKLFAVAVVVMIAASALSNSRYFAASANEDVLLQEIANYKTWHRMTNEPIKVASGFQIDGLSGGG